MLGTNHKSASYAAEFGTGYVFGHYMSEQNGVEVLRAYRQQFKPSKACSEPSAIVAVSVICADTEAEAVQLAAQSAALFQPHREQQPQQAPVNPQAEEVRSQTNRKVVVGNPGQVRAQLLELREKYEVDEFVVINSIPDYKKRLRSFELLASAVL
jgi:alkanesulfonate monooxygenase SsuD/methylene tetrahydromethanopterin reductase-like flavin-dependent oxidoreductase (luciferase family)